MKNAENHIYDVAILGSGIGGSLLACILAKKGLSTLLVEDSIHPRFAIGESLIPETSLRFRILAEKYDVPEIGWLSSFHSLRDRVSSACGVKRSFSFAYHRQGERHSPKESIQFPTLAPPFGPDAHLFRQDVDAFLTTTAVAYGTDLHQQVKITRIEFGAETVVLHPAGERSPFRARFLVDAGGMRSPLATQLGLRDATPRWETNTRAIYTHLVGVPSYDLVVEEGHGLPYPFGEGTMHHIFDGGWMWIIPFNNHDASTNQLTSVGLVLDRRKFPDTATSAEEEFRSIVSRYPSIQAHLEGARAVRPWVKTGRLQYSSSKIVGDRWLQLPHAAAFVDPLFSSGMSVLAVAVDIIAGELLAACAENDFSVERFQPVEDFTQRAFEHYDMVIARSFDSWVDNELWNSWSQMRIMSNFLGTCIVLKMLVQWYWTKDRAYLASSSTAGAGVLSNQVPEVVSIMRASSDDICAVRDGNMTPREASARVFERLKTAEFLPKYMGFGSPDRRYPATFTLMAGARHNLWFGLIAPKRWREACAFSALGYVSQVGTYMRSTLGLDGLRGWQAFRDIFFANRSGKPDRPGVRLRATALTEDEGCREEQVSTERLNLRRQDGVRELAEHEEARARSLSAGSP